MVSYDQGCKKFSDFSDFLIFLIFLLKLTVINKKDNKKDFAEALPVDRCPLRLP